MELLQSQPAASASDVNDLAQAMMQMPQAPAMDTEHFFGGGMYCRKITIPAGRLIVSKVHGTEHFFVSCVGQLAVAGEGPNYVMTPGTVVVSSPGTKRVVYALTDVVVMTVHRTDKVDTDGLEEELMQDDGGSLYDVNNAPKPGVLCSMGQEKLEK
jgi:hypothetical protein